jgi:hypothetical protein
LTTRYVWSTVDPLALAAACAMQHPAAASCVSSADAPAIATSSFKEADFRVKMEF